MRKIPPRATSGLTPGALYRVVQAFTCEATLFNEGDVLRFEGESFIPAENSDVWRFTVPDTGRLRAVVGNEQFADPKQWRSNFEPVAADGAAPATPHKPGEAA